MLITTLAFLPNYKTIIKRKIRKTLVIFGAGEGISFEVAKIFLSKDFNVVLVSRNLEKLKKYQLKLSKDKVKKYDADLSDQIQLNKVADSILKENDTIDVVLYNAANVKAGNILEISYNNLIEDFKINVAPLLTIVLKFKDRLAEKNGALLITGGGIGINPNPQYASLSLGKAALKNLTLSIKETLSKFNIFVGTILINGYVNPKASIHNPENIASTFWKMNTDQTVNEILL